jgi:hypothetical protein
LVSYQRANNVLPCGWSQDGLYTFNALAREISKDLKEHGDEFKKAFKMTIQQQTLNSASNKNGKQKHNCINTYNDLNKNDLLLTIKKRVTMTATMSG